MCFRKTFLATKCHSGFTLYRTVTRRLLGLKELSMECREYSVPLVVAI